MSRRKGRGSRWISSSEDRSMLQINLGVHRFWCKAISLHQVTQRVGPDKKKIGSSPGPWSTLTLRIPVEEKRSAKETKKRSVR